MSIGAIVRRMLGPAEIPVLNLYRSFFVDLDVQMAQLKEWVPEADNILEIGCGEGAVAQKLAALYPRARITGIDITPRVGRTFRGDSNRVRFACTTAGEFAAAHAGEFDLVLSCDVLHHVPWDQHASLMTDTRKLVSPGGTFVLKEWELIRNFGHLCAEFSDRILTGDNVRFGRKEYFFNLLEQSFGSGSVVGSARIRPWPNNLIIQCRSEAS